MDKVRKQVETELISERKGNCIPIADVMSTETCEDVNSIAD